MQINIKDITMLRRCINGLIAAVCFLPQYGAAESWQMADAPLATRWAKDVSPENVWPEYPRPQLVREGWQNLNGLWDYAIRPKAASQPEQWDGKILVPFAVESALSGVGKPVRPDERLWYRRQFAVSLPNDGKRLLLHFGAVDWQCTVWVNDKLVGEHTGGFDPFTLDITNSVRKGENELLVAVWDPTDSGSQPRGKQVLKPHGIWYTAVSGIWQTVWLESVPTNYVKSLKIIPDVDSGIVSLTIDAPGGDQVRVTVEDDDETIVAEGRPGDAIQMKFANPRLWSPDSPHLYELTVELLADGKVVDTVESYCGLRKIEVRKDALGANRLFLNGEPLFQFGPLDQGWWPDGLYTPPTDEAIRYDIEITKQYGMNMARKHTKYEPARWYYWCDKLGLLVWQDMPSGDSARSDQSKANFRSELNRMIDTLHNHPSIVMWVPFNESWGQHDTAEVVAWLEQYDPTRLVNEASGWTDHGSGQISDMHSYPGPGMRPVEEKRAIVLGEFGGLGLPIRGHTWQDRENWGYISYSTNEELTDAYVALLAALRPLVAQGLAAAVYTQTSDVEGEVNGLLTYDRAIEKIDRQRGETAARRLYGTPPKLFTLLPTSESNSQTWRYTTIQPESNWFEAEFDDATWQEGAGGFGTEGTRGAVVNTTWNTPDIWLRTTFELDSLPEKGELYLRLHHDDDAEIYLNGRLVAEPRNHLNDYTYVLLTPQALARLRVGTNNLAIHCRHTEGGQYIDAGLAIVVDDE